MDSWNISTLAWLRRTVYERAYKFNTLAVFTVSAFWHGFYPGYYLAFFTGALFIEANRSVSTLWTEFLQKSQYNAFFYFHLCISKPRVPRIVGDLQLKII